MGIQKSDITVVGYFSIDSILLPNQSGSFVVLGGSVTYVSLAAKRLESSVSIISKVGGDFPETYMSRLREEGIDLSGVTKVANELTTRFELEYSIDLSNRILRLRSRAPPIALSDVPLFLSTKAVHAAPIAGEISYDVLERLSNGAEILSMDPQGLLRNFDTTGNVTYDSPIDKRLLTLVDIYKSSQDEISAMTGIADVKSAIKAVHDLGVEIVIVTLGAKGSMLSIENTLYNIPVCCGEIVVDPTGAGDAFMGGFLAEYIRQKDPLWCGCVGSAAASFVVQAIGPTLFGEKEEIYNRAETIYEKGIKQ